MRVWRGFGAKGGWLPGVPVGLDRLAVCRGIDELSAYFD